VTDEAWANAAKHYDEEHLAALASLIPGINAWNRMNVITRHRDPDSEAARRYRKRQLRRSCAADASWGSVFRQQLESLSFEQVARRDYLKVPAVCRGACATRGG
jgi:hypothetical protein